MINEEIISLKSLISKISIKLKTTGDKEKFIESKVLQLISKNGFAISSQKGMYQLNVEIDWNETEFNDVYSSYPKINFSVYKDSEIIKSFEIFCEKCSAYNYQTLKNSEVLLVETNLEKYFVSEFFK